LSEVGRVIAGDARTALATLPGPFDLVFIDAEKDDYVGHFDAIVGKMRPRGLVLADNVISHDLSVYQAMLRARADIETVTVPIGRGVEFSVVRGAA
ncbi:MAG TPA: class I SAM-dependent methyltransferase, partial [Thermomicrobiales bacterium]|nr:class I SAM-dependent methyltransferase [Thermomicrobiales bacterium]